VSWFGAQATGHLLHGLALYRTALKRTARDGYPTLTSHKAQRE